MKNLLICSGIAMWGLLFVMVTKVWGEFALVGSIIAFIALWKIGSEIKEEDRVGEEHNAYTEDMSEFK